MWPNWGKLGQSDTHNGTKLASIAQVGRGSERIPFWGLTFKTRMSRTPHVLKRQAVWVSHPETLTSEQQTTFEVMPSGIFLLKASGFEHCEIPSRVTSVF